MSDTPTEPELPRAVALAWGVAANPQRGPKRELSIERIVDVAVALADAGGLAAVSMSAVASELGFTPMSLYRYVTAKDDLLVLMQERGLGLPPETVLEQEGWRARLREWADTLAEGYVEHPWMLDIAITGTPMTPNNLAWLDTALEALADAPITENDKLAIVLTLIAQVRWQATVERGQRGVAEAGSDPDALDVATERMLTQLVTAEELPSVRRALDARAFDPVVGGDPLAFGLERLLDGIEAYLAAGIEPVEVPDADPLDEQAARDPKVKEAVKARREAEKQLREARKRERERLRDARERLRRG